MEDVRASGADVGIDSIAVICAAEVVKRNLIETMERKYAAQGQEAIDRFHADLESALATYIVPDPDLEAS